jgi:hypothetical protein
VSVNGPDIGVTAWALLAARLAEAGGLSVIAKGLGVAKSGGADVVATAAA